MYISKNHEYTKMHDYARQTFNYARNAAGINFVELTAKLELAGVSLRLL